jgi:hypothetical protein
MNYIKNKNKLSNSNSVHSFLIGMDLSKNLPKRITPSFFVHQSSYLMSDECYIDFSILIKYSRPCKFISHQIRWRLTRIK